MPATKLTRPLKGSFPPCLLRIVAEFTGIDEDVVPQAFELARR